MRCVITHQNTAPALCWRYSGPEVNVDFSEWVRADDKRRLRRRQARGETSV